MALTLRTEQRLEAAGLIRFFNDHRPDWTNAATQTYNFIADSFPDGATIRQDDVAKALVPVLEVDESLRRTLNEKKLRQKYWVTDFTDLIIDRTWNELGNPDG